MKQTLIISFFCFVIAFSNGQSLSPSVIGSTGEQFASASGSLEWTLGEIMTETYRQSIGYFTQGFHQPTTIKITGLEEAQEKNIFVYPNPVRDVLYVKTTENGDYLIELFDMQGWKAVNNNSSVGTGTDIHQINLTDFSAAMYLLRIVNITTGKSTYHKVEKL